MSDNTPISQHDLANIPESIARLAKTPKEFAQINTFMKRKTHISQKAILALADDSGVLVNPTPMGKLGDTRDIDNLRSLFANSPNGRLAPLTLEIGFGMGTSLFEMAQNNPTTNFVGVEVHEAGIGNLTHLTKEHKLNNLKIINGDAIALMNNLPDNHLDSVQLFFPDPWQKKRHYKRRFVNAERMSLVLRILKSDGIFHAATDWEHYALWILNVLDNMAGFDNMAGAGQFSPRPASRPLTKFEHRGINKGHGVWDLLYQKK